MIKKISGLIFLLFFYFNAQAQYDYNIFGYITDENTGEPIVGARVSLPDWQTETYTNNFGYFSISVPPQDFYIAYSFSGYEPKIDSIYIDEDIQVNIKLTKIVENNAQLSNVKKSQSDLTNPLSGKIDVPTALLRELPYILSEPDLIKGLQSLPGITAGNEFFSNLYVRGGAADQNLILLDGVPVYNGTHLFGLYSIFQPDITNSLQVYKAGFPARYGGRVSSVVDITSNEGSIKEHYGSASLGLLIAKLSVQGPIGKKERTTYSFGIRRTYWDAFTLFQGSGSGGQIFVLSDYNLKLKHKLGKNDYLHFAMYTGRDKYPSNFGDSTVSYKSTMIYGNLSSILRWNHIFGPKLFSNISVNATRYKVNFDVSESYFDSVSNQNKQSDWKYKNGIGDIGVNMDFEYSMNNNHFFHFGIQNTNHFINPGYSSVTSSDNPGTTDEQGIKYWAYSPEVAAYLEDDFKVSDKMKVNAGMRVVYFNNPKYKYSDIFYEPRLSGRYLINPKLAIKASYSRMHQTVFLLTNSGIGTPFNFWVPATKDIPAQKSDQFNLGFVKEINKSYSMTVDGYYKTISNILFAKEDPAYIDNDLDWQTILEKGKSTGYGLEMLIQKNTGFLTGWLGYTLAFSERQFDNLNLGRPFKFSYNRLHTFNLVVNYRINEGNSLFVNLTLGSGRYFTIAGGKYLDIDGNIILDYSSLNNYKGPFFQRLDLGCLIDRNRYSSVMDHRLLITLYNALLARNPYTIYTDFQPSSTTGGQGSYKVVKRSVPVFIPGLTYILKF